VFFSIIQPLTPYQRSKVIPFVMEGRGEVPAAVGPSVTIASAVTPSNYITYILAYGVTVRDPVYDYSGSLSFSLQIGGGNVLSNTTGPWTAQRGSVASPIPTMMSFLGGAPLAFISSRVIASALAQTVDFFATGWSIPAEEERGRTRGESCTLPNQPRAMR
jgi:hypothetical protein